MKRMPTSRGVRREAPQAGQAMVEFMLVTIFLLVLFVSILQMILLMHAYNTLADAAKEGIRYQVVHGTGNSNCSGPGTTGPPAVTCSDTTGSNVKTVVTNFAEFRVGFLSEHCQRQCERGLQPKQRQWWFMQCTGVLGKSDGELRLSALFRIGVAEGHAECGRRWKNHELSRHGDAYIEVEAMRTYNFRSRATPRPESGQAMLFVLLALGIFLIGAMAFAIDLSNLWFSRQAAQTAADAACMAGAMDILVDATNGTVNQGGFNTSTSANPWDCNLNGQAPAPCQYATLNGFGSSIASGSTALGNNVSFAWSTVANSLQPPGVTSPPPAIAPVPFMKVTVTDNIPTFFAGLLKGMTKQSIGAVAGCGVSESAAPIPILVLDSNSPHATPKQAALIIQGTPTIQIFGGPSRSIQVNSSASAGTCGQSNCSVNSPWGTATIDLSHAGPLGTGADMALSGAPTGAMSGFSGGTTGHWIAPAIPMMDPFAQVCYPGQTTNCTATLNGYSAPSVPGVPSGVTATNGITSTVCTAAQVVGGTCNVRYQENGCPDIGGCVLYEHGLYSGGIQVGPGGGGITAIFDPGLYYVTGGLALRSLSTVRPGTGTGDGSGGVTFYFSGTGTVSVASDSGTKALDPFNSLKGPVTVSSIVYPGTSSYPMGVKCVSSSVVPTNLQGGGAGVNLQGNILMGPCTGYYGDPLGTSEPASIGEQRWFLFFQDRSAIGAQPSWGGGGQFLLAGTMYFHSCNSSGSGVSCTPPSVPATATDYYQDIYSLSGNSGSGTFVLGEIVTDNLTLGGTSGITMDLNPTTAFNILKASLYQ